MSGPLLSIGDLAHETGVSVASLRAWESRHGFPTAIRLPSGHRRYDRGDVARVAEVLRLRDAGLSLTAAIRGASSSETGPLDASGPTSVAGTGSVFATLRERHPHLAVEVLRKSTLTALSWAIEDEFCARADRARIFGAFQHARHFQPSLRRWTELSRVAASAFVFADFGAPPADREAAPLVRVTLPGDSPLLREWAVVCDSDELPVVLTAWEVPGQELVDDADRSFEAMWSVDPLAVRDAARVLAACAARVDPAAAAPTMFHLADRPVSSTPDLTALSTMFTRVLRYVDRHRPHA
ncbi:DICT sensory domain-containing protein [Nocardioides mangrovi]|uniref:MerR family transcriptional regulator n=1 Tax=Nocardioides mangrovi TaxID=2874580 RepID=A0ABS7UBZ8_9ACTN|nr:DICT sensory domain-containing protein [Nocardioides mangrovi]MBZ5738534.1 MerR family transcriptional regulator [Nocardioides mangrovi]